VQRRTPGLIATLLVIAALVAGCGSASDSPARGSTSDLGAPGAASHSGAPGAPASLTYPKVKHIFLIVLENESYSDSYLRNPNPYLGRRLQDQGTLLTRYYAVGHHSLDNYIAMISGQAPNSQTSGDCLRYTNLDNTTAPATLTHGGQAKGTGCVYPRNVKTLADQLSRHHIAWHGYMQSMGNAAAREQARCGVPHVIAGIDDTQAASPSDQYAARHNPFVYFHSLIDSGLCRTHVGPLTTLPAALKHGSNAASFSFITPDLCDDGHDSPCAGTDVKHSNAGGLTSVDHFLSVWVPRIKRSPAYRNGGLIIITSDESQSSDTSSCCYEQPGPGERKPGETGPGGGRIGALLIGKCVAAGATDAKHYNHYSLLRSLENLFGIATGGTDGKGHLGYAAGAGLRPFGPDVFTKC
jgi:hypothetical protein